MIPNENNNIDILINYNDNIDKVSSHIKSLDAQIKTMQSNISKASNNQYNQQKGLILAAQQKIKVLQAELSLETKSLAQLTKLRQDAFVAELKNTHTLASAKATDTKKAKADSIASEKAFLMETRQLASAGARIQKEAIAEEISLHRNKTKEKAKLAAIEQREYAKSWRGAMPGSGVGSTFGHKVVTTAQYAAAGTALFGVANATIAMGQAALEADLNMRTMSAVLKLNIAEASTLDTSVRKLGETYGGTTAEIEQVAIALGRAGVATNNITAATKVVLSMARLTGDTFEQSANAVISYQQVFGDTKNITELGNKLAYIANVSRLSTQDIGTFSNYALAAAKDVGLTEDAVGGLAAAFSNAGVNASTIGTQIRRFTTLLTENSTDVTNFFQGIGVNQANLLNSLQKGGKESNKAMMEFVDTLGKVDKSKFTQLTGQMDILAANSLQLMRNNSANINKYIAELQTGVSNQLENTKVILESYIVTFESMWNSLKNFGIKAIESQNDAFTEASIFYNTIFGNENAVLLGRLALERKHNDQWLEDKRSMWEQGKIGLDEWTTSQQNAARTQDAISLRTKQITGKGLDIVIKTKEQNINDLDTQIQAQVKLLSDPGNVGEAQVKYYEALIQQKDSLVKTSKNEKAAIEDSIKATIASNMNLDKQLSSINALKSAKLDSSKQEKIFNDSANAAILKNEDVMKEQLKGLEKYQDIYGSVSNFIENNSKSPEVFSEKLLDRLNAINNTPKDKLDDSAKTKLLEEANVYKVLGDLNNKNIEILAKKNTLIGNNLALEDASQRNAETARRKAEVEAERLRKYDETKTQHLTSIAELENQINQEGEISLTKAESKFRIDSQLLGLAHDAYQVAKGTTGEKAAELTYLAAYEKYMKSDLVLLTKQAELNEKRKALSLELNSNLTQAIEGEQVRLGIIEKSTDSEYEKLRVKIEQGKIDNTLVGNELVQAERRLAELRVLQSRKKDIHTLAMEYQREIQDQETMGYIAAKAGLTSLESGMANFFDVTSEGWLDWHSLASNVLTDIYKQLLQQLVIKQLVSGIAGGIGDMFSPAASTGVIDGVSSTAFASTPTNYSGMYSTIGKANGGMLPAKGFANGGMLSGGTGIRDDIYLGNTNGTRVFAMGGEFITRKSSVNDETKGTLDYINKTGSTPSQGSQVNVPVKINIENNTGQGISADMIESITKPNDKGEYEKVVNIVLKASMTDPRIRSILKGR